MAITTRARGGPGCFLLLWLIGWTVGCVTLAGVVYNEPNIGSILFAVPFWAAWIAVASFLIWCYFGSETLLVRSDRVLFLRKAIITLKTRQMPRDEVIKVDSARSKHQENDQYLYGIEVVTTGQPLRFGFRLPDRERIWLVHQLNHFLGTHGSADDRHAAAHVEEDIDGAPPRQDSTKDETSRLTLADTADEPPSDTRWSCELLVDGTEFTRPGQFQIGAAAGLLFVNCFWNGIVSVFVLALFGLMPGDDNPPQGWEWWAMFVFLIPFEVIGLVMFAALVSTVMGPFCRTTWRLEHSELVRRIRWPLFSMTKRWNTADVAHLQIRRATARTRSASMIEVNHSMSETGGYELVFVSPGNAETTMIKNLTTGEARWMAGIFLNCEPEWAR